MDEYRSNNRRPVTRLLLLYGVAILMLLVPFLFWRGTWFGRALNNKEMEEYLSSDSNPRKTQHALVQISERLAKGATNDAKRWYPAIERLATHPAPEIRAIVAWLMGQDNKSEEFHRGLSVLVQDSDPLVRRNAALALIRFEDTKGKAEISAMLQPYKVRAPREGTLAFRLKEDDSVNPGTLLARIQVGEQEMYEVRSPLPGFFGTRLAQEGKKIAVGEEILLLSPAEEQVWEALRALYLVGQAEDLPDVERFAGRAPHMSDRIRQQALQTISAIKQRGVTSAGKK